MASRTPNLHSFFPCEHFVAATLQVIIMVLDLEWTCIMEKIKIKERKHPAFVVQRLG